MVLRRVNDGRVKLTTNPTTTMTKSVMVEYPKPFTHSERLLSTILQSVTFSIWRNFLF